MSILRIYGVRRSVDGVTVEEWDLDEIKNLTVGLEGTHVTMELRRGAAGSTHTH